MSDKRKLYVVKPFGPGIGEAIIPNNLIDKINKFVDDVASDKEKSKKFDWGKHLAGQVAQEIYLPKEIIEGELINFLSTITKTFVEGLTNKKITKFNLIKVWVVRQFENEYNPVHWHGGHISGAGYLKLPNDFGSTKHSEKQKVFNGKINFIHGTRQFLSASIITKKPELGKIFVFPNYLMHSVNPFYGKGERRSMSFNAMVDEEIYDVHANE